MAGAKARSAAVMQTPSARAPCAATRAEMATAVRVDDADLKKSYFYQDTGLDE